MKIKRAFIVVALMALILAITILAWREAYFVVAALVAGVLLVRHRELWSLIRRRKLLPLDERARENINKSLRNGFIFFTAASAFLMLFFYWFPGMFSNWQPDIAHVLGGLFIAGGLVYLLSFLFYDRAEPRLDERWLKVLRILLLVAGISVCAFIITAVLHNVLSGLFGMEEAVFFVIAVIICPLGVAVGIIGSLIIFIRGLLAPS